ncbi:hypothetical protein [Mesorhizobium sp. GbtcB19]|uniref:hypothetical protein n=1 Tax=Mesorhizobium sp. GbtcB19 TaxID=2824764 RepID=UPI001C2F34B0|nr:hypothetical protein [Mesorhizobium sp. GbtcB19]
MKRILTTAAAGFFCTISAASAGNGEQKNIDYLARMADDKLSKAATMAGDMIGVMERCRLRPTEDGKAIMTVPVLLYDGLDKHLAPDLPKFKRAAHTYERAYAMAVQRAGNCQTEKAKYPGLYR